MYFRKTITLIGLQNKNEEYLPIKSREQGNQVASNKPLKVRSQVYIKQSKCNQPVIIKRLF